MPDCFKHPGFVVAPESLAGKVADQQLVRPLAKKEIGQEERLDAHLQKLTFEDFYNTCFVKLKPEDKQYEPTLKEATRILFDKLRRHIYPSNSQRCVMVANNLAERNEIPDRFNDFKLVFVRKELPGNIIHYWTELVQDSQVSASELPEKFYKLKRLVIDFNGISPQNRDIVHVKHSTYTPFFGSAGLAHDKAWSYYADTKQPILLLQLTGKGQTTLITYLETKTFETNYPDPEA